VRRWLAGDAIPEAVAQWIARVCVESDDEALTIRVQR
jgi:hypothetical protein